MASASMLQIGDEYVPALNVAVNAGKLEEVVEMLAKGEDVEAADSVYNMRPIHLAVRGHLDILKVLIAHGCDVNARASCISPWNDEVEPGTTALHLAAAMLDPNLALTLITAGADVNAKSTGSTGVCPLHIAAFQGHLSVAKVLVSAKADVNAHGRENETPLLSAVRRSNEDVAEFLVQNGALVNARNSFGSTPLHFAAERGNLYITRLLIQNGAKNNLKNLGDYTPLLFAIYERRVEVIKFLIDNGADVNAEIHMGVTPLHIAAHNGCPAEIVRLLIAERANINARDMFGRTPLYRAAGCNLTDIVNILIENKAEVNVTADSKWTPLHETAYKGCLDTVKILIANGATVDAKTDRQATPLHYAANYLHVEVVEYLLAKGADVNASDDLRWTALHFAIVDESLKPVPPRNPTDSPVRAHGCKLRTAKALIQNGANVNAKGISDDDTPLQVALRYEDPAIVKCLLDNGAEYDARYELVFGSATVSEIAAVTNENISALLSSTENLFKAVKRANCSEIEKCVKEGAPVNCGSGKYGTPLMYASWKGRLDVVNVLLGNGASVNLSNSAGITPLHYTAKFGHHEILRVLLQHGAVYNARTKTGKKTPLHFAREGGNKVVADTLEMIERMFIRVSIKDNTVLKDLNELKDKNCAEFLAIKNCKNVNGETLSQISSKNEYEQLCELFCDL